jgi:hypothetical protein
MDEVPKPSDSERYKSPNPAILNIISVCIVPVNMLQYEYLTRPKAVTRDRSSFSVRWALHVEDCHDPFCKRKPGLDSDRQVDGKPPVVK